jgi:MarR family 2-MHQ and catechol resistance regulon transcriptional repressor
MSLEDDIKQKHFKNQYQKAGINILYTYNYINEKLRTHFSHYDLTPQQYNVMRILRGSNPEPLSTLQIRERMLDKMSDSSRIVDRLVKKELASKSTCASDKRLVDVCITDAGLSLLTEMDNSDKDLEQMLSNLSEKEAIELNALLDKIRA